MATGDIIAFQILGTGALPSGGNINGNGVIARIRLEGLAGNIGGSFDLSKLTGSGASPGWNRARTYSATNVTRAVALTERIARQPFPNQTARIEAVAGSHLDIYAYLTEEWFVADTLASVSIAAGFYTGSSASTLTGAGLTNSSTRPYRMPQISWVNLEPWRRMTSAGLTVEAIIDHHNARDGQPVAAVDFYVTRSAVTSTASTSTMVLSDVITTPFRPGLFRATVPIGSLSNGEGDLGATIYPWVGNATWDTNSADFETFPCVGTAKLYPVNIDTDSSFAPAGAYVSHTGVQIGTPTIGLLSAMGAYVPGTTPAFATIQAVANAARAWNNNAANRARVHDDMAGIVAVIPSGVTVGSWGASNLNSTTTFPPGLGYFTIAREAGSSRGNTGLTTNARTHPSRMMLDNVGIFPGAAGSATHTVTDGGNFGGSGATTQPTRAAAIYFVTRDCTGTGNNDNSNAVFSRAGYVWQHRNSFTNFGDDVVVSNGGTFTGLAQLHGCTINNDGNTVNASCNSPSVIGCSLRSVTLNTLLTGAAPDVLGRMVHSTRADMDDGAGRGAATMADIAMQAGVGGRIVGVRGESWVNIILRKCLTGGTPGVLSGSPTMQVSADFKTGSTTDQVSITNVNMAYITLVGSRYNGPYNEAATTRILKEVRQIGIAAHTMNAKADLFAGAPAASGNRTGTFAYRHGVARLGIVTGDNGSNGGPPSPTSWLGEVVPPLSQNNVGYGTMFVADTSLAVGNSYASAGNYTPQSALFNRIPAGRAATGFDLNGNPRRNDNAGAAGAIERSITPIAPASAVAAQRAASPSQLLLLPLEPVAAVQAQSAAASLLLWTVDLAPAASGQGQRGAATTIGWSTIISGTAAASPQRATSSVLTLAAVNDWLLPVTADQPQSATRGRLLSGAAVTAARTLVPGPLSTTLFVH